MTHGFPRAVQDEHGAPYLFSLSSPYPNPLSPALTPTINMPEGFGEAVVLDVMDRAGLSVREIYSGNIQPGSHTMQWNGRDNAGEQLKSGIYFYRLRSGTEIRFGKVVLLR